MRLAFIVFIILVGSAICSMVESALFSASIGKVNVALEQKKRGASSLLKIKENMHCSITVIVIINNIFNIVGSIFVGLAAVDSFGSAWIGIVSGMFVFLVIVFGEIIPKTIGTNYSIPISLFVAKPLLSIIKLLSPAVWFIDLFIKPSWVKKRIVSEEEIKVLSHLGYIEGSIEADEKEMIQKIFTLNDLTAKDIMTPRTVIKALSGKDILNDLKDEIYLLSHSRLPIYEADIDNIIGICHQRELLIALGKGEGQKEIRDFIRSDKPSFVSENIKLDELIRLFQKGKFHLAIVVDEFGGTAGVVTLEDVLEQIVGEIVDETDEDIDLRVKGRGIRTNIILRNR
ncbi:MAG: hemolysin family protein [Candidatus Pacebacteria bacterium]|nr:hemolysin family protein [Candidatus Paceibacterota bacterium]